jgi:hypothetical protein
LEEGGESGGASSESLSEEGIKFKRLMESVKSATGNDGETLSSLDEAIETKWK